LSAPPRSNVEGVVRASFAIAANGFAEGPAQALRDYLVDCGADVVTVFHPLTREQGTTHLISTYPAGSVVQTRSIKVPLRPPLSYAVDPLVPLRLPSVDAWFGFNPLACARGLAARRFGHARKVVLWSVDFVPNRFGSRSPLTRLYNSLDRIGCTRADGRVELSEAARLARDRQHGLRGNGPTTLVVPMGAWLGRTPTVGMEGFARRSVVFLGHLVPRQGVGALLDALAILEARGENVVADVIGTGPDEPMLRERVRLLGLANTVRMHGFVADHREVEHLLAASSIGIAPYEPSETTFTRHADPGKLKAYLAAGLPIILTDVPPNARELARDAGAVLVRYDPVAIADAIADGLASAERWGKRRSDALRYVRRFDWAVLLPDALARLGFDSS
jgi:glycosyltransferase involved in cell wall biosynthesis